MKARGFIMVAMFISCVLWTHGVWAGRAEYIDSGQTSIGGVVGAKYTGTLQSGSAIKGDAVASAGYTRGGYFRSYSPVGVGVAGYAQASSGANWGGWLQSNSTSGIGVYGMALAASGYTYGGVFESRSTSGTGVWGRAEATYGYTTAGQFYNSSTSGTAVFGIAQASSGTTYGGNFRSLSTKGTAVLGLAQASSGYTYGGWFESRSPTGWAVAGYAPATSGVNYGGSFQSRSTSGRGVAAYATATSGVNYGVYAQTSSPSGYGVYSQGNMRVVGKLTVTGTKSAVVKLKDGKGVSLYAVESSENWFEDFGSSKLRKGRALVAIESTFAETVNTGMEYHVFLTPNGESRGLYVTNKKGTSFEVREVNGGKSEISFSYRIVAKRKGYEDQRLAKVDEDETVATQADATAYDNALHVASHVE